MVNPNKSLPNTSSRWGIYMIWALVVFTIAYRIIASQNGNLSNTSPTMALCFGGGLLLGRRFWWAPALLIVVSDFLIGLTRGGGGIGSYTVLTASLFCLSAWLGSLAVRWNGKTWPTLWCGVLLSSVLFYLITNTFCWAVYPGYPKSLLGWWQSQTTGLPGYIPSWCFLRNALIADSIWCVIAGFLFFFRFSPGRERVPATL